MPAKKGFAAMDPEKQRQIASKGGKSLSIETRREIGRKGGMARAEKLRRNLLLSSQQIQEPRKEQAPIQEQALPTAVADPYVQTAAIDQVRERREVTASAEQAH